MSSPSAKHFDAIVAGRPLRRDQTSLILSEVLTSEALNAQGLRGQGYLSRLSADKADPPFFVNGVPIAFDEDWMQGLSQRLSLDLRKIQQQVYEGTVAEESNIAGHLLEGASTVRNPILVPEDERSVTLFNMNNIYEDHATEIQGFKSLNEGKPDQPSFTVFVDLMSDAGRELFTNAVGFALSNPDIHLTINHFSESLSPMWSDKAMDYIRTMRPEYSEETFKRIEASLLKEPVKWGKKKTASASPLAYSLGLKHGQQGVLVNGRLVGPLPTGFTMTLDDFETLTSYEQKKRIQPAVAALRELGLGHLLKTPQVLAKVSSIVARSSISDVPEGIFDTTPGPRTSIFEKWKSEHTSILLGQPTDAAITFVASLDPVSETAQRWAPMLHVLAQLGGVQVRIFLNPSEMIQELPVKRFYRQVLFPAPSFSDIGGILAPGARFDGIPEETLLTLAMDTPPSWLVAPEDSLYDLDNIKLSSLKTGEYIDATYELEHILIEGHSRETSSGAPPRGAQLLLGTEFQPDLAGTIVMANLGYFQFKANPGVYDLALQPGKSENIFNIDSAGTMGHAAQAGDETREVALSSFLGATIFPRLSRKPGQEQQDVLDMPEQTMQQAVSGFKKQAQSVLAQGGRLADDLLAKAGL